MSRLHTHKAPVSSRNSSSASLFVSLYLVILAFFIMLNSIAQIQKTRSIEAMRSVVSTFSNYDENTTVLPYIESSTSVGSDVSATNYFSSVGRLAKELLSITDADIVETGNKMIITIPAKKFYAPGTVNIRGKQRAFLNRLADQLTKNQGDSAVNIEFMVGALIGVGKAINDLGSQDVAMGINRAGTFARVLKRMGVNESTIYVGLTTKAPKDVQMTFTVRDKLKPIIRPK